jgi:hypothetical protein
MEDPLWQGRRRWSDFVLRNHNRTSRLCGGATRMFWGSGESHAVGLCECSLDVTVLGGFICVFNGGDHTLNLKGRRDRVDHTSVTCVT